MTLVKKPSSMKMRAVTVGNFDGVHRGHRLLLERLRREAAERKLKPAVITFTAHPLALIDPRRAPKPLQTIADRNAMLQQMGFEIIELEFNDRLRHLSAADFLQLLHSEYRAQSLMLGHDNRFGFKTPATTPADASLSIIDRYRELAPEGMEIIAAPQLPGISSSEIRKALSNGEVQQAAAMLGRPYRFTSEVVHGRRLGRTIGFPTANLKVTEQSTILPAKGVYIGIADSKYPALINIGSRPTVDRPGADISVEAYLDGFEGNLYGSVLSIDFQKRLRDEKQFADIEALKQQLQTDLKILKNIK